jgi:hypothetical protein
MANYHNNLLEWLISNVSDDIRYRIWFPLLLFSR